MPYHLNVLIDDELNHALRLHMDQSGLKISQAVRDLLRHALGTVSSSRDAGWHEGYTAAVAEVRKTVNIALREVIPP